jgi:hypothetical protein
MQEEAAIDRAWWAMLSSKCCCINKGRLLVFSFSGRTSRSESDPRPIKDGASQSHKGQEDSTCKRYTTGTRTVMTRRGTVRITSASRTLRLTLAIPSREMLCYCNEAGMHKLTSARRAYGNIAAGSKILSNPEIMGSSDNVMMWSRYVRRSSSD